MKELSIEEKAKRYDEAIERAKGMHEQGMMSERIEYIFPELKESKDEKIRKVIYGWIYTQPSSFFDDGFSKEEMLAWLEKQGEQKPDSGGFWEGYNTAKEKFEQKSAWSEEDEKMKDVIYSCVDSHYDGLAKTSLLIWLKSLKPQNTWKPSDKQLNNLLDVLSFDNCTLKRRELLESLYNDLKKLREE